MASDTLVEQKALTLLNEVTGSLADDIEDFSRGELRQALCCAIEQREEAADRIEALEAALRDSIALCNDCGGRGTFPKHDEVTGKDLWETCQTCASAWTILEGKAHGQ